jgi:hypothetical protein
MISMELVGVTDTGHMSEAKVFDTLLPDML